MDELYRENILDHYKHPRNAGRIDAADFSARELNPSCGDAIELFLKTEADSASPDGLRVASATFDGRGCAISQASASMLTEKLKGLPLEEARALTDRDILAMLGIEVGPLRMRCATLSLRALAAALDSKK